MAFGHVRVQQLQQLFHLRAVDSGWFRTCALGGRSLCKEMRRDAGCPRQHLQRLPGNAWLSADRTFPVALLDDLVTTLATEDVAARRQGWILRCVVTYRTVIVLPISNLLEEGCHVGLRDFFPTDLREVPPLQRLHVLVLAACPCKH